MKVAYVMSRFPVLTETFILYEMLAVEASGVHVEVYPLLHEHPPVVHPEAEPFVKRAHYSGFFSWRIAKANWAMLFKDPPAFVRVFLEVLRGTWGNANYFVGGLCIFPKAIAFASEMQAEGIDHIHAHFSNHATTTALVIHRLTGISFSFTAHGHDLHINPVMVKEKTAAALFAVTISEYNRNLMCDLCGEQARSKIHVLHCGIDPLLFSPRQHLAAEPLKIICIAALIEVKGIPYLIDACSMVKRRGIRFVCEVIGKGPDKAQLEHQVREAGLDEEFRLVGPMPHQQILEKLAAADLAVQPSVWTKRGQREGIPVALMEAMATGLPVVASNLSGIPELVEDGRCGFLVPPRNSLALADAIEALARVPERRREMGMAGYQKVTAEFNLHLSTARLLSLFENRATVASQPEITTAGLARAA